VYRKQTFCIHVPLRLLQTSSFVSIGCKMGVIMREIKFRAWCIDHNESCFHGSRMIDAKGLYFSDELEPFIDSVQKARESFDIMQFTGARDIEGNEIYEGDIVVQSRSVRLHGYKKETVPDFMRKNYAGEVVYDVEKCAFMVKGSKINKSLDPVNCLVIGHKYEK